MSTTATLIAFWTCIGAVLALVGYGVISLWRNGRSGPGQNDSVRVALRGARRRLQSAQLRAEIKADGARLRRELDRELSTLHRGRRS
jgi:hypothetical protein